MMRMIAMLLWILVACGPGVYLRVPMSESQPITVCLDMPLNELAQADAAVQEWDASLHSWHPIVPVHHHDGCTISVKKTTQTLQNDPQALAWTSRIGGNEIYMRAGAYESDVKGILEHELGHAFGAQHVDGTLMQAIHTGDEPNCPDKTTVMQVAAWNHIDISLLTWCDATSSRN